MTNKFAFKRPLKFKLIMALAVVAYIAFWGGIVYCGFWLLSNPEAIGEWFGRLTGGAS